MTAPKLLIERLRPKEVKPLSKDTQHILGRIGPLSQIHLPSDLLFIHSILKHFAFSFFMWDPWDVALFWYLKTLTVTEKIPRSHIWISYKFLAYDRPLSPCSPENVLNPWWEADLKLWYPSRSLKHTFLLEMSCVNNLINTSHSDVVGINVKKKKQILIHTKVFK